MRKIVATAVVAAALVLSSAALAKGTYVLSINGVNNNRAKAESNMDALERDIIIPNRSLIEPSKAPVIDFVHNETEGLGADLVDVWLEKSAEQALRLSEGFFSVGPLPRELGDAIQRRAELAQQIDEQAWGNDADLRTMVDRATERMKAGDRVFLMPHSQGNLYANRVYDGIFERPGIPDLWKDCVGISGVASAASRVAGPYGVYVTSSTDVVIAALNAIRGTLPSNITLPVSSADFTGHGLQEIYLANSASKTVISANAVYLGRNVKYPGTIIADLSPQQSDTAALDDLTNDSNNKDPELIEPGKSLFLEGSGLASASFEVPGVEGRLSASVVAVPASHPLSAAGSEVYRLSIPAGATVGASGKIRSIITSADGAEQVYESPRAVQLAGPQGMRYSSFYRVVGGFPSDRSQCPSGLEGAPDDEVWQVFWVERVDVLSGPDAGKTYERDEFQHCGYGGGNTYRVSNLRIPKFDEPGAAQASIRYDVTTKSGEIKTVTTTYGANVYRNFVPRSDGFQCDVTSYSSSYFESGGQIVGELDGTIYEDGPTISSCSDEAIERVKSGRLIMTTN